MNLLRNFTRVLFVLLSVFLLIEAGAYIVLHRVVTIGDVASLFASQPSRRTYNTKNTPYNVLTRQNEAFVQAEAAYAAGNYSKARELYKQALSTASDSVQAGQIEYKMAILEEQAGTAVDAVLAYKDIVANQEYASYPILKAYALQSLIEMYYSDPNPAITKRIFTDAPYSAMYIEGDMDASYKNLAQYAVSFYPLGLPELRIASWYVKEYSRDKNSTTTEALVALTDKAIFYADADVERTKADTNAAVLIPSILSRKAALLMNLQAIGLVSVDKAEIAARAALDMFKAIGRPQDDGYSRYYYAVLLSRLGEVRREDVRRTLSPFYNTPDLYREQSVMDFFASERTNRLGQKQRIARLAVIDSNFKILLISKGWNEKDFTTTRTR